MTGGAPRVRTLIVDDEPLARRRLRTILAAEPDVDIVGEASNGTAAVQAIVEKRPDLLLLDIQMPGKDGFEVLKDIAAVHQPVVVFITAHDEHAIRAFDVQAVDYVLKPVVEDRLRAAVRRAISRLGEQRRGRPGRRDGQAARARRSRADGRTHRREDRARRDAASSGRHPVGRGGRRPRAPPHRQGRTHAARHDVGDRSDTDAGHSSPASTARPSSTSTAFRRSSRCSKATTSSC